MDRDPYKERLNSINDSCFSAQFATPLGCEYFHFSCTICQYQNSMKRMQIIKIAPLIQTLYRWHLYKVWMPLSLLWLYNKHHYHQNDVQDYKKANTSKKILKEYKSTIFTTLIFNTGLYFLKWFLKQKILIWTWQSVYWFCVKFFKNCVTRNTSIHSWTALFCANKNQPQVMQCPLPAHMVRQKKCPPHRESRWSKFPSQITRL